MKRSIVLLIIISVCLGAMGCGEERKGNQAEAQIIAKLAANDQRAAENAIWLKDKDEKYFISSSFSLRDGKAFIKMGLPSTAQIYKSTSHGRMDVRDETDQKSQLFVTQVLSNGDFSHITWWSLLTPCVGIVLADIWGSLYYAKVDENLWVCFSFDISLRIGSMIPSEGIIVAESFSPHRAVDLKRSGLLVE